MADLHKILKMLHVSVITEKVDRPINMIRERWVCPKYRPDDYEDCCRMLISFMQYFNSAWTHTSAKMPEDIAFSRVENILENKGGFVQVVKDSLAGREGGIVAVLDMITEKMKDEATESYITYILNRYVNPLEYDSKVSLMQEYINEFAHVLPGERLMSAYEMASNFEGLINFHLKWIYSFRRTIT